MNDSAVLNIILAFLAGGGVVVAIIGGIREALAFRRQRKAQKEDVEALNFQERLEKIEQQNKFQSNALKFLLYDRIRYLGQCYIVDREISIDNRRILNDMHHAYHDELGGNGDLDVLMKTVNELPLSIKK